VTPRILSYDHHCSLILSFPTRRSSDLDDTLYGGPESDKLYGGSGNDKLYGGGAADKLYGDSGRDYCDGQGATGKDYSCETGPLQDRKSTRLNSSHQIISYAGFCLKKKN